MSITRKTYLKVESFCDLCGASEGTSLITEKEYKSWVKNTTDLLTFEVDGKPQMLCWDCIVQLGKTREYDKRLNELTYPKAKHP
jgi:hypothetical protein